VTCTADPPCSPVQNCFSEHGAHHLVPAACGGINQAWPTCVRYQPRFWCLTQQSRRGADAPASFALQVAEDGQLCVKGLQITALDNVRNGLDFFCHRPGSQLPQGAAREGGDADPPVLSQAPVAGSLAVRLVPTLEAHLAVMVAGMETQVGGPNVKWSSPCFSQKG
jgi:hypothetical protein